MFFESGSEYNLHSLGKYAWKSATIEHNNPPRRKHGLLLIKSGSFHFKWQSSELTSESGDLIYLPEGSRYVAEIANAENYLINFENSVIKGCEPTKLLTQCGNKYCDLFKQIIDLTIRNESDFLLKSQFYLLLDNITKDMYGTKGEKPFLEKVKTLLEADENYSVTEIAKSCAICESGLRRLFKSAYGISPIEYKLKFKINKAKFLLESSTLNVAEISEKLGFYDAAYFTKAFKRQVGCTPTEYIKRKSL